MVYSLSSAPEAKNDFVKIVTVKMLESQIYLKLNELFRDVFGDDDISLSENVTASDIDGWDSLSNIRMILSVESTFGIRLSAAQVASLMKLGDLVALIAAKTS